MGYLVDYQLEQMCKQGMLVHPDQYDKKLINPASIDIRLGVTCMAENQYGGFLEFDLRGGSLILLPGEFILAETYERIVVPNGYGVDLRLKSSMARQGLDHTLAFWFDPGWDGIGTFELKNVSQYQDIRLFYKQPIANMLVSRLEGRADKPYSGKYQGATGVEQHKLDL